MKAIVSPHPDDAEMAAGGLILAERPTIVVLANCGRERRAESEAAAAELGVPVLFVNAGMDGSLHQTARVQAEVDEALAPFSVVYGPHPMDWHQDHRVAAHLTVAATRRTKAASWLYGAASCYERAYPDLIVPLPPDPGPILRALRHHRSQSLYSAPLDARLWRVGPRYVPG